MRKFIQLGWIVFGLLLAQGALAEIYRWTDEEGKVHYSDRKPKGEAEDITDKVSVQNIDTSQEERRKLQEIFRPENDADREHKRRQQQGDRPSAEQVQYCRQLRTHIRELSGRVQIVNDQGKEIRFTEKDRQEYLQKAQALLQQRCANVS